MSAIRQLVRGVAADDCGATSIEYALLVSLIGVAIIQSLSRLGGGTGGMWTTLSTTLSSSM